MIPPSLPNNIRSRSFLSSNGEMGIRPTDVTAFLVSCERDSIEILGWELWIIDHDWSPTGNGLVPAEGYWSGGIPLKATPLLAIVGGEGNLQECASQISCFDFQELQPEWLPFARVNFTLA